MNVIMGLPRSGSTLLCNILAQNPAFQVEHTNPLPGLLRGMIDIWSKSSDIKGGLLPDRREETEAKLHRCALAFCEAWNNTDKIVFNKSRDWGLNLKALWKIYPDAKVIVLVRDLREIFASFMKQDGKNPLLDDNPVKDITQRAVNMFSSQGMIGGPLIGVEDILTRRQEVHWVKYEDFVRHPMESMERMYCFLDEPSFEHNFDEVVNTATDPDHLYLHKFPHNGEGKVEPQPPGWPKIMNRNLANSIMAGFPWFNQRFGYQLPPKLSEPLKQEKDSNLSLVQLKEFQVTKQVTSGTDD